MNGISVLASKSWYILWAMGGLNKFRLAYLFPSLPFYFQSVAYSTKEINFSWISLAVQLNLGELPSTMVHRRRENCHEPCIGLRYMAKSLRTRTITNFGQLFTFRMTIAQKAQIHVIVVHRYCFVGKFRCSSDEALLILITRSQRVGRAFETYCILVSFSNFIFVFLPKYVKRYS